jgi:hypothetical protein
MIGMPTLDTIRRELDEAIEQRAALWESLSEQHDEETAVEAARLSARIEELWAESRSAKARLRFGSPDLIIARARAEDRLDREARRLRRAA